MVIGKSTQHYRHNVCDIGNLFINIFLNLRHQKTESVFVAQLVEQLTLNQWVQGSSPCEDTKNEALTSNVARVFFSLNLESCALKPDYFCLYLDFYFLNFDL